MTALLIDSGVESVRDLAGLLPEDVRGRIEPELLTEPPTAAALRVLATIRDPHWRAYIGAVRIDWAPMLAWARAHFRPTDSIAVRVETAASLAGFHDARPPLLYVACALDQSNLLAVMDALRIAAEGLSR